MKKLLEKENLMKVRKNRWVWVLIVILCIFLNVFPQREIITLNQFEKAKALEKISTLLDQFYVIPKTAQKMIDYLKVNCPEWSNWIR